MGSSSKGIFYVQVMLHPSDSRGRLRTNILEIGVERYDVKACMRCTSLERWTITRQKPQKMKGHYTYIEKMIDLIHRQLFFIGEEKEQTGATYRQNDISIQDDNGYVSSNVTRNRRMAEPTFQVSAQRKIHVPVPKS